MGPSASSDLGQLLFALIILPHFLHKVPSIMIKKEAFFPPRTAARAEEIVAGFYFLERA